MRGYIEVQDSAAPVLDEEVEGDDRLAMIPNERQPIPFGIAPPPKSAEITSDGSFGYLESELSQLAVDPWSTPADVLLSETANQIADLQCDPPSSRERTRFPTPVPAEPGPVPGYHGIGLHD